MRETKQWVRITACEQIPVREGRTVIVGGREIAIFNLGDRFLAVGNRCPHRGGPLSEGIVSGASVVCPLHALKLNLETGEVERPASGLPCVETFPTRVEAGIILLELRVASASQPEASVLCIKQDQPLSPSDPGMIGSQ